MTRRSTPAARHWAQIDEAGALIGIRFLFGLYRLAGRWPLRLVLYPVVLYFYCRRRLARQASRDYLHRLTADRPDWHRRLHPFRHFIVFAETLLERLLCWAPAGAQIQADVELRAAPVPGLILTAHVGNLDLSRVLARHYGGAKLNILLHSRHAEKFNRMLHQLNPASQINLLAVTDISPATAMLLADKIAAGEFIVIAADRIPVQNLAATLQRPFLGQPAAFPTGPWLLAHALQCPVYWLSSIKLADRYRIRFELLHQRLCLPRAQRAAGLSAAIDDFSQRLQQLCHEAPYQWFNFYPFWAEPAALMPDPAGARA